MNERDFIPRDIEPTVARLLGKFPVLSLSGPRQSGKSTLLRRMLPDYRYVSLEDEGVRARALADPVSFLRVCGDQVIIDEVQRAPALLSYMQGAVDADPRAGRFVLSGSQDYLLMRSVSQSLAGRAAVLSLLPLSLHELTQAGVSFPDAASYVQVGGYPAIYDRSVATRDYFPSYIRTYLDRDVRLEVGASMLGKFERFVTLCAARVGSLLNKASLAADCQVDVRTVDGWLSVLQASRVVRLLEPYSANVSKRLVKTPKIYFCDTGLVCGLLGIDDPATLAMHPQWGGIFENAVVEEVEKRLLSYGQVPQLSFWRDSNGLEADLVVEHGGRVARLVEIKASATYNPRFFSGLARVGEALSVPPERRCVVYSGDASQQMPAGELLALADAHRLADPCAPTDSLPWSRG